MPGLGAAVMGRLSVSLCQDPNCVRCRSVLTLTSLPHREQTEASRRQDADVRRLIQLGHSRDEAIATACDPRFRGFDQGLAERLDREAGL